MTTQTELAMKQKALTTLEQALVDKAKEIAEATGSPAFLIPFIAANGRKQFIAVGPYNAIPGLMARARRQS
jgi:hypothetical protein